MGAMPEPVELTNIGPPPHPIHYHPHIAPVPSSEDESSDSEISVSSGTSANLEKKYYLVFHFLTLSCDVLSFLSSVILFPPYCSINGKKLSGDVVPEDGPQPEPSSSNPESTPSKHPSFAVRAFRSLVAQLAQLLREKGYVAILVCTVLYQGGEIVVGGWISSLLIEYLYWFSPFS